MMNITLDATTIPLLATGILGIIAALVTGILTVLGAVRHNTSITEKGQIESQNRSEVIHQAVNGNTDKLKAEIEHLKLLLQAANEALADLRLVHRASSVLPPPPVL